MILTMLLIGLSLLRGGTAYSEGYFSGWKTNFNKKSISLNEIQSGGPTKDGIPAIDHPRFLTPQGASSWLGSKEPVVLVELKGEARAYPLQILIWHEIANDRIGGVPIAVTFCPLCYSAIVFDRRVGTQTVDFGVSGFLRKSDMVMYDRQTESFWQQMTGEAMVGDLTGKILKRIPSQIISFEQFKRAYPKGKVLSRETGFQKAYGRNPYGGYDDIHKRPFLYPGPYDQRLPPMEKIVLVSINGKHKAYPYSLTKKLIVINDTLAGKAIVLFHSPGALSALDKSSIRESKEVGSTGVFEAKLNREKLEFLFSRGKIFDRKTGSQWDITGKALSGPFKGKQLKPVFHGDYFAFAWFAFEPKTKIYTEK